MIHLLWTTVRLKTFIKTLTVWVNKAKQLDSFRLIVAIDDNTNEDDKNALIKALNDLDINFNIILARF
jgi:GTP-binding protein EngB required for normal cell division